MGLNKPVKFTTAKLLKEKGFDKKVRSMFCESKLLFDTNSKGNYNDITWVRTWRSSPFDDVISAPTISDVVMWLYEKHGFWLRIHPVEYHQSNASLKLENIEWCYVVTKVIGTEIRWIKNGRESEPSKAYEAAIEYTLKNLIP